MKTRNFIWGFLIVFTFAWSIDALYLNTMAGDTAWVVRKQAMYLTGIWSMASMSIAMLLATRPSWLENIFAGMDKIYHLHKWLGITAITAGLAHWLIKLTGSQVAAYIGTEGKPARDAVIYFMTPLRSIGKDLGEWSLYILLALLVLALYKRLPYQPWRKLHKIMPILYLLLVVHTLALTPMIYWNGLTGLLLAITLIVGSVSAIYVLAQQIGKNKKHGAKIIAKQQIAPNVLQVSCAVEPSWPGHTAGQFAFLKFKSEQSAHPFTIASAPNTGGNLLNFEIKALGDFTQDLANKINIGQSIEIEGPYGRFNYKQQKTNTPQVWVAAGIGITPFIAWLEDLQANPSQIAIDMHYCVKDAANDPLVAKIKKLCAELPSVKLYIHDQAKQEKLSAKTIIEILKPHSNNLDVWFCGPQNFAKQLKQDFSRIKNMRINLHKEEFNMR